MKKQESRVKSQESRKSQMGQVIIILLLLMLVALSVGLALTQRSVIDVTTSSQTEQASRAFSAAEAGLEKALSAAVPAATSIPLGNNATAQVETSGWLPPSGSGMAIEYPPIGRETTAQFWFVDPVQPTPVTFYNSSTFDVYFGNENTTDKPAIEVKVVTQSNNVFYAKNYYYDSDAARSGPSGNRFTTVNGTGSENLISGILGTNRKFFRKVTVGPVKDPAVASNPPDCTVGANCKLILARVRFLYANENHRLALAPIGSQLPPQVQIYNATGTSGLSEKRIQAFKVRDVVLPWFDFALFSVNEISK